MRYATLVVKEGIPCNPYDIMLVYKRVLNEGLAYKVYIWNEYYFIWFCRTEHGSMNYGEVVDLPPTTPPSPRGFSKKDFVSFFEDIMYILYMFKYSHM